MAKNNRVPVLTANDWFAQGERISYTLSNTNRNSQPKNSKPLKIFRFRHGYGDMVVTLLGGFPDGSYGWSRVLPFLPSAEDMPKLFLDYVGQGDSDKPKKYPYGVIERADLVEAQWRDLNIHSTTIVTFDYSSLVAMELLRRQQDRQNSFGEDVTKISGVMVVNGGLFADGHSHPFMTTPLLKTPVGRIGTWFAQRSRFIFGQMMMVLWSREYGVSRREISELYNVVTRRNGAAFLANAAGFVDEHKSHSKRWDFGSIFHELRERCLFLVVGSKKDPFEHRQVKLAKKRLAGHGLDVRMLPGGHLTTSEHPDQLAALITDFYQSARC